MVYSDLVGGANGHLGIILYPYKYNVRSCMLFICPLHPVFLVIPAGTIQLIVTEMQTNHKEFIRTFEEVLYVEDYLRHKIITAIDVKYITVFRDRNNNSTKKTIDIILKHLFGNYGKIPPQMITRCEDVVKQITFDVNAPIDNVFGGVE